LTAVCATGLVVHRVNREGIQSQWTSHLDDLSSARALAVERWLADRRRSAELLARFPTVQSLVGDTPQGDPPFPEDVGPVKHLGQILRPYLDDPEVTAIAVLDRSGEAVASFGFPAAPEPALAEPLPGMDAGPFTAWVGSRIRFHTPTPGRSKPSGGWLVMDIDRRHWLDPFMTVTDGTDLTSETYLIEITEDAARVLSPLRHLAVGEPPFRVDLEIASILRTAGSTCEPQQVANYRGVDVLSVPHRAGENGVWVLAEVARTEVDGAIWRRTAVDTAAFALVGGLILGGGALLWIRRQAELTQRARRSETLYKRIVETTTEGVMTVDLEGRLTYVNRQLAEMVGFVPDDVVGRPLSEILDVQHVTAAKERLKRRRRGEVESYELEGHRPDGSALHLWVQSTPLSDDDGEIIGGLAMVADVTDLKQTQDQLVQAQKLEAVGRFSASVAHDFNNLLQIILGTAEVQIVKLRDRPDAVASLQEMIDEVTRGAHITRQLLVFARQQPTEASLVDLRDPLESIIRLLRHLLREGIVVECRVPDAVVPVIVDPIHVEQIVTNLALNAADAMPDGGTLSIALENRNGTAEIRIRDTGIGMSPDIRAQVFNPFFSTKDKAKGTGLGLSIAHQLARSAGGRLELVDSEVGAGSEFALVLPTAPDEHEDRSKRPADLVSEPAFGAGQTILLVEDDPTVRATLAVLLEQIGYRPVEASGLEDAKTHLASASFAAVICDVVLSDGRGEELIESIDQLAKAIPVIFVSGYAESETLVRRVEDGSVRFLRKPFGVLDVATALADALRRTP
jgi:two-component system cell cycle sensor histidine kinase/response regulator CckA